MAVRRKKKEIEVISDQLPVISELEVKSSKMGKWGWIGLLFAVLCVYWWKTNSWPIVAVAGMKPIWRHAVNQELYKQGGKSIVDSLVTQRLVEVELGKARVKISDQEVEGKLDEIKKGFEKPEDFEVALADRNMSLIDLKKQIELQMGIEKLLSEKIEVTASETAMIIKEMGTLLTATTEAEKQEEAKKIILDQKLQMEINTWIESIRSKGKVWWIGRV